jgi:lysophospholipase L1-like esterase
MRRWWVGGVLLVLVAAVWLGGCKATDLPPTGEQTGGTNLPSSMASIGDSISAGYGACLVLTDCYRDSWATGDGAMVASHYRRILAGNKAIEGHAANFAHSGATAADLIGQADEAAAFKPGYLTVMIGSNDACRPAITDMTSVDLFRSEVTTALGKVKAGSPKTHVLLVSVPNIYRLWQIGHDNRVARTVWSAGICPSLLANANSMAAADVSRRQQFTERVDAYNTVLAAVCASYGPRCKWDGGAVHGYQFVMSQVSALDFFHPNADGQGQIAKLTYPGDFGWGGTNAAA